MYKYEIHCQAYVIFYVLLIFVYYQLQINLVVEQQKKTIQKFLAQMAQTFVLVPCTVTVLCVMTNLKNCILFRSFST
jgi:uncharacterized membrane protein YesL